MQQKAYLPSLAAAVKPRGDSRTRPRLERIVFKTDRLGEFVGRRELTAQIGHPPEEWLLVLLKEAADNALDICEEALAPPELTIEVSTAPGSITVTDNGPGITPQTVRDILNYTARVSSREAYVSPTRGAQGNALKTLLAMPFALSGTSGSSVIEARRCRHEITFRVDELRQRPVIDHQQARSDLQKGTRLRVDLASSVVLDARARFLQMADDLAWLNPHLRLLVTWDGIEQVRRVPSEPAWKKWRACDPTSAHWYDEARLTRYIAAHVARDQDHRREHTVREFLSELRGFSGSAKQKQVLEQTGLARTQLSSLFDGEGQPDRVLIGHLLQALKTFSKPVKPLDLGLIGKEHLRTCFDAVGLEPETFKYRKAAGEADGLPWIVETAFGWCPGLERRRIVVGVNWSVALGSPFRSFGATGEGLESLLADQRAGRNEPVVFVLHFACPRTQYTDRGKSAIVLPGGER
jgi:DNA topoisomerase VI subunit B